MAYVNVPKDLTRVKNKIAFNMTKRQLICLGIAVIMGIPFYFLTRNVLGTSNAATGMVFLMLPAFLFAWYEKDGMHLEQILRNIIRVRFLRPAIRTYETVNRYAKKEDVEKKGETIVEKTQNQKRKRVKGKRIAKKKDEKENPGRRKEKIKAKKGTRTAKQKTANYQKTVTDEKIRKEKRRKAGAEKKIKCSKKYRV